MVITGMNSGTYVRTKYVIEADVGGELVLLHTLNWRYVEFDKVGAAIWALLEEPTNLDAMVTALQAKFEVGTEQCREETKELLDEMIAQGLVVAADG
ncbi:MAG: PqqD family protein [Proteobacteria bacterium]|nr:PqqD family protein [Pseudomonadota bacterium]